MSKVVKSVFHPIGNLFTRPKSVFGKSSNWISDFAVPAVLGVTPGVGPALAAGYGGWRGYSQSSQQVKARNRDLAAAGMPTYDMGWGDYAKSIGLGALSGYAAGNIGSGIKGAMSMGGGIPGSQAGFEAASRATAPAGLGIGSGTAAGSARAAAMSGLKTGLTSYGINKGLHDWWTRGGTTNTAAGAAGGAGGAAGAGGLTGGQKLGGLLATGAGIASLAAKPPTTTIGTSPENLEEARRSVLSKYMGDAAEQIPEAVASSYLDMIQKPIGELYPVEKDARWGRIEKHINESYDDYEKAIQARYAQAGGLNSSDYKEEIRKAKQDRTKELSQSRAELEQSLFDTQIAMKKDALVRSMENNKFDEKLAYDLAGLIRQDDQLRVAIDRQDYDQFQNIMAQIMSIGANMATPNVSMFR